MSWLWNQPPSPNTGSLQAEEREERHRRRQAQQDQAEQPQHLSIPPGITRRHNRSPSPLSNQEPQFFAASSGVTMASQEQLNAIKEQLRAEMRAEMRLDTAYAAARDPDTLKKKPEIPPFDKKFVDIWIRRMENAYIRAGITSIREKFAFLETKFPVDLNPRINEYLYGESTQANWDSFLSYLRQEYGPTKQQQASHIVDGFKREGRRPTQYAAALDHNTKDITLEDVKKEMLLREMPVEVRRMLQERIEGLTFKEAATIADAYFDQEGKPRHSTTQTSVHHIVEQEDDNSEDGINAVDFRSKQRQRFNNNNGHRNSNNRGRQQSSNQPAKNGSKQQGEYIPFKYSPMKDGDRLCCYHERWGDEAKRCEVACSKFDEKRYPGNDRAGRR